MKTLLSIIESPEGMVVGAETTEGEILLPESDQFPRAELPSKAAALAEAYGVAIPESLLPAIRPA